MASALLYPINRIRYAKSAFKKMGPHGVGERLHACTTMRPAPATRTPRTTPRSESNHRPAVIGQTKNYARHIHTHTHTPTRHGTQEVCSYNKINKGERCNPAHRKMTIPTEVPIAILHFARLALRTSFATPSPRHVHEGGRKHKKNCAAVRKGANVVVKSSWYVYASPIEK